MSLSGASIVANTPANIAIGEDTLPSLLNCPVDYVAMCSISDTGSNLCGCYFPHVPGETWAPIKPSNFTCVDNPLSVCPAGEQWSVAQNKCIAQCESLVTLTYGSNLTAVKNSQNEAFSTNAQCAGKQISLSPCSLTTGAILTGTSPNGNKLYNWPKTSSGLSRDYSLVDIGGQCWFADNLEEKPSSYPNPLLNFDNFSPHTDYGFYNGIDVGQGYLYQMDAVMNGESFTSSKVQ